MLIKVRHSLIKATLMRQPHIKVRLKNCVLKTLFYKLKNSLKYKVH